MSCPLQALQAPACHENMVKVGGYILGEFGNLIAGDPRSRFVALAVKKMMKIRFLIIIFVVVIMNVNNDDLSYSPSAPWSSSIFFILNSIFALCQLVPCCCQPTSSLSTFSQRQKPPFKRFCGAIARSATLMWSCSSVLLNIWSFLLLLAQMSWLVIKTMLQQTQMLVIS